LAGRVGDIFDKLAPTYIWVLGLALLISIGVLSNRLIIWRLSFGFSILAVALLIGGGMSYLGWAYSAPISTQRLLLRMVLVLAGVVVSLVAIDLIDDVLLVQCTEGANRVIYRIPGVYAELAPGSRRMIIDNAPPYWMGVTAYGLLAAFIGHLIHRAVTRVMSRR
jgi:hypothetical protein